MKSFGVCLITLCLMFAVGSSDSGDCGEQHNGTQCAAGYCCSNAGFCGTTEDYCSPEHCQSQCPVGNIITEDIFDEMLPHRHNHECEAHGFYTYDAFINATKAFPEFGRSGNDSTSRRELAAFFGQTSHETDKVPHENERYTWGYCIANQTEEGDYCDEECSEHWPCATGQQYFGRGPIQLRSNCNYGPAGRDLNAEILNDPGLVARNATLSFETAIWFWMTPQHSKPSCHNVMVGSWTPTTEDVEANRLPGYGVTTNIIAGSQECGVGSNDEGENRIGFFKRYCDMLQVDTGDNLDCYHQEPFEQDSLYGVLRMPVYKA